MAQPLGDVGARPTTLQDLGDAGGIICQHGGPRATLSLQASCRLFREQGATQSLWAGFVADSYGLPAQAGCGDTDWRAVWIYCTIQWLSPAAGAPHPRERLPARRLPARTVACSDVAGEYSALFPPSNAFSAMAQRARCTACNL